MVDFSTLLSQNLDSVTKPKALPAGTYNGTVLSHSFALSSKKQTPYVQFNFSVQSAGEDVDPSDLEGVDVGKKALRTSFYLTDDALFRLKDFLASCGIDTSGRTLNETIPETVGASVLLFVKQRTSENGEDIFNDVDSVRGV